MDNSVIVDLLGVDWRERLFALLDRQQVVCGELMDRCQKQSSFLDAQHTDKLTAIVRERQQFVDELGKLGAALDGFRENWPEVLALLNDTERLKVEQSAEWMERIVQTILARDETDRATLQKEQARVRRKLASVGEGLVMHRAYGKPIHRGVEPVTNRFADQRG